MKRRQLRVIFRYLTRFSKTPKADIALIYATFIPPLMARQTIEHLWSSLWASRFTVNEPRLRFELGGEEFANTVQPVPRFLQAHQRASAIADALFRESCVGVVASNAPMQHSAGLPNEVAAEFVALQSTGFHAVQVGEWQADLYPDPDEEPVVSTLRSYDLGDDKVARDTLLWHSIAAEMPIWPSAPVRTFLIDPGQSVMLHVYDDRGMDVIADNSAKLYRLYSQFADYLLDYDRERMAKLF